MFVESGRGIGVFCGNSYCNRSQWDCLFECLLIQNLFKGQFKLLLLLLSVATFQYEFRMLP